MGWFRKKKQPQDELISLFRDALSSANENAQKVQSAIFHKQRPYSDDFGLCEKNPIFTSSLTGTEQYLSKICTDKWEKFTWKRCRSIRVTVSGVQDVAEDVYTLYLNGEEYTELYFVMYCGESEAPPAGLYFYGDSTDWDIRREAYRKGVTVNQLVVIQQMEAENKFRKEKAEREFREAVERKSRALKDKYPDVSIEKELQDELFSFLSSADVDLLVAYEYVHKADLHFHKKELPPKLTGDITEKFFFDVMHQMENAERQKEEAVHRKNASDLQKEAAMHGITVNQMLEIWQLKAENAQLKWDMRIKTLKGFANQAVIVKTSHSNFNLEAEWSNLAFRKITEKFGMLIAYEILHFCELYTQEELSEVASERSSNETETVKEDVVETMLFCRKCGKQLPIDSVFCISCGEKVIK